MYVTNDESPPLLSPTHANASLTPTTNTTGGNTSGSSVSVSTMPRARGTRRCSNSWVGSMSASVITIVIAESSSE